MEVISGKELSASMKKEMAEKVKKYAVEYGRVPNLVVVLLGEDPGSVSYVTGKTKAADEVGIKNSTITLSDKTTEEELLSLIHRLNEDKTVDGILVQLPLPKHIDENKVIETIAKDKDVDGFHPLNVAALWQKRPCILPCTPKGIIRLIKSKGIEISGKKAVVIGRSNIVGLPVAKLLLDENATVTITHSRTPAAKLEEICRRADILIAAAGCPKVVTAQHVKRGAVVVDVGMNRTADGKLCGDVDFEPVRERAAFITPVPGGVGPMTIAMLMQNTVEAAERHEKARARG